MSKKDFIEFPNGYVLRKSSVVSVSRLIDAHYSVRLISGDDPLNVFESDDGMAHLLIMSRQEFIAKIYED